MNYKGSKRVHKEMISSVLRAPVNIFFDVTPTGTILNRFSKDLAVLDNEVGMSFGALNVMMYYIFSVLIVISLTKYYIILVLPVMIGLMVCLFNYSIPSIRESSRIESVSKSPMLNLLTETYSGSSTIRAYNREKAFIENSNLFLD